MKSLRVTNKRNFPAIIIFNVSVCRNILCPADNSTEEETAAILRLMTMMDRISLEWILLQSYIFMKIRCRLHRIVAVRPRFELMRFAVQFLRKSFAVSPKLHAACGQALIKQTKNKATLGLDLDQVIQKQFLAIPPAGLLPLL